MVTNDIIQVVLFLIILLVLTPVLGNYMSRVFSGKRHFMVPVLGWLERLTYRLTGVSPDDEENWKSYTFSLLMFNLAGLIFVFLIQVLQRFLPLNPQHFPGVSPRLSFQYRCQLYDEYELAGICRRNNP